MFGCILHFNALAQNKKNITEGICKDYTMRH